MDEKYVDSSAYHEAGHTVVAVALEMPLRKRGIEVDSMGCGISYYWFRVPGDLDNTQQDIVERERTIVSTEAGFVAQSKFYPGCPVGGNLYDRDLCIKLLDEMYRDRREWLAAQERLLDEATRLVEKRWPAIEALAKAILDKPLLPRQENSERQWSVDTLARRIDGNEVAQILKRFDLEPQIRDESEGKFLTNLHPSVIQRRA
jgi:hypothetical protein